MKIRKGIFFLLLLIAVVESIFLFLPSKNESKKLPTKKDKKDTIAFLNSDKKLKKSPTKKINSKKYKKNFKKPRPKKIIKKDLNTADAPSFEKVRGVGKILSKRIVKYRKLLQGFSMESQVYEVYGLDSTVVENVLKYFIIKERPKIKKTNLNKGTFKEILRNPYLNFEMTKKIFQYKNKHKTFESLKNFEENFGGIRKKISKNCFVFENLELIK